MCTSAWRQVGNTLRLLILISITHCCSAFNVAAQVNSGSRPVSSDSGWRLIKKTNWRRRSSQLKWLDDWLLMASLSRACATSRPHARPAPSDGGLRSLLLAIPKDIRWKKMIIIMIINKEQIIYSFFFFKKTTYMQLQCHSASALLFPAMTASSMAAPSARVLPGASFATESNKHRVTEAAGGGGRRTEVNLPPRCREAQRAGRARLFHSSGSVRPLPPPPLSSRSPAPPPASSLLSSPWKRA